LYNVLGLINEA